jgi:hypothetical protein
MSSHDQYPDGESVMAPLTIDDLATTDHVDIIGADEDVDDP